MHTTSPPPAPHQVTTTTTTCHKSRADLLFLLDVSDPIDSAACNNQVNTRAFVADIIDSLADTISAEGVRVGFVAFSNSADVDFKFVESGFDNPLAIADAVRNGRSPVTVPTLAAQPTT